jgi:leucyl-tRNA synthetase
MDWTEQTDQVIEGCGKFLDRLWRLAADAPAATRTGDLGPGDVAVRRAIHRTVQLVTGDIDRWSYNTAVAHCMEQVNLLQRYSRSDPHTGVLAEGCDSLLLLLAPMAPHVTAELWEERHPGETPLHARHWPAFDPALVAADTVTMVVQVNGKVRDRLEVDATVSEEEARAAALASPRVVDALGGREPARVVVRPPRLVNVVV